MTPDMTEDTSSEDREMKHEPTDYDATSSDAKGEQIADDLVALRAIDPINFDDLERRWTSSPLSHDLLASTIGVARVPTTPPATAPGQVGRRPEPHRRRSRRSLAAMSGAAAVLIAAITLGVGPFRSSPAYAVRHLPNGVIEIDWERDLDAADDLTAELREFGIDVKVVAVPASPSAVGKMVGVAADPDETGAIPGVTWGDDGADDVFTWKIDPSAFRGPLTINLAVEAKPGTHYEVAEEVFEPGEALGGLHCALGEPVRASQLVPYLKRLGLHAEWMVATPLDGKSDVMQEATSRMVPEGEILWGHAIDDSTISFTVRPDGVHLDEDHFPARLSDLPCTPEQAARW